jgi:uncharacterized membrane protein YeaQ/YmgE (transglycosylase-associated protein family)
MTRGRVSAALQTLVIVTLIGIAASWAVNRYGRGWFGTRADSFIAALAGIAGAFMGFHLGAVIGVGPSRIAGYIVALLGSFAILWIWRNR